MSVNWDLYPNFSKEEFDCKHTGKNKMRPEFLDILQQIRTAYNAPLKISSGYRDPSHPVEAGKDKAGEHTYGVAVDIAISGAAWLDLVVVAYGHGVRRIGVKQRGNGRFIHLGLGDKDLDFPATGWSY